jgi:Glycosyltransferase family 87
MRKDWSAIAMAMITALALAGTSVLLWGAEPWLAYINIIMPFQVKLLETMNGFYARMMITPYGGFYGFGAPPRIALLLQGLVAIAVAITSLFMLRRDDIPWSLQVVIIAFGTSLLTPYMLAYDLAIPLAAMLWHFSEQDTGLETWEFWIYLALWALCFSVGVTVQVMGFPLLPILMMLVFVVMLRQAFNCLRNALTCKVF